MIAVFCGSDIHKETTYATVLDSTRQVVNQRRMKNDEVPEFLEPLKVDRVAIENSMYIIPMYRKLTERGYDVTSATPRRRGTSPRQESNLRE